jgi:hypothetical protein
MKYKMLNLLSLFVGAALSFTETGGGAGTSPPNPALIFSNLKSWSGTQFRQACPDPVYARGMRVEESRNTLLHEAITAGNVDVTRMLVNKPYSLDPNIKNALGETSVQLAIAKGGEFDGIFKDISV